MNQIVQNFKSPNQFFNTLNTVFYGFLSILLIFFSITYLSISSGQSKPTNPEMTQIFNYLVPFICVIEAGLGIFVFDLRMKKVANLQALKEKLSLYFQSKIIKWALFEGAGFFAVVAYFLTGFQIYAFWCLLMVMLLSFNRPSVADFKKRAALSREEELVLQEDKNF